MGEAAVKLYRLQPNNLFEEAVRRVTCIEFKPYGYRKPKPDKPKPTPPGQGVLPLTDREPVRSTREVVTVEFAEPWV